MGNMCVIYILHMLLFSALVSSLCSVSWESYYRLLNMVVQVHIDKLANNLGFVRIPITKTCAATVFGLFRKRLTTLIR